MARKRLGDLLREEAQKPVRGTSAEATDNGQVLSSAEATTDSATSSTPTADEIKPTTRRRATGKPSLTSEITLSATAAAEATIAELQAALKAAQDRETGYQQTIATLEATIQHLQTDIAQLETVKVALSESQAAHQQADEALAATKAELAQTQTALAQAEVALKELETLKQVVRQVTQQNADLEQRLQRLTTEQPSQSALTIRAYRLPTDQPSPRLSNAELGWVD